MPKVVREQKPEHFHLVKVDDDCIENTPRYGKRTADMPWTIWLFCEGFKRKANGTFPRKGTRFVWELTAPTSDELADLLEEFITRPNIELQESKSEKAA